MKGRNLFPTFFHSSIISLMDCDQKLLIQRSFTQSFILINNNHNFNFSILCLSNLNKSQNQLKQIGFNHINSSLKSQNNLGSLLEILGIRKKLIQYNYENHAFRITQLIFFTDYISQKERMNHPVKNLIYFILIKSKYDKFYELMLKENTKPMLLLPDQQQIQILFSFQAFKSCTSKIQFLLDQDKLMKHTVLLNLLYIKNIVIILFITNPQKLCHYKQYVDIKLKVQ